MSLRHSHSRRAGSLIHRFYSRDHDGGPGNRTALPPGQALFDQGHPEQSLDFCRCHYSWIWADASIWALILIIWETRSHVTIQKGDMIYSGRTFATEGRIV